LRSGRKFTRRTAFLSRMRSLLSAILVLLVLVATGCGDDGAPSASALRDPTDPGAEAAGESGGEEIDELAGEGAGDAQAAGEGGDDDFTASNGSAAGEGSRRGGSSGKRSRRGGGGSGESTPERPGRSGGAPAAPPTTRLTPAERAQFDAIEARLGELIRRTNARDGGLCTELFTQRHVEEATGLKGGAAIQKCKVDIASTQGTLRLKTIHGGRLEADDRALIQFTAAIGGREQRQVLRVKKFDGRWFFDGDGSREL